VAKRALPLFEIALVLVRLDHIARSIVKANHGVVRTDEKLAAFLELERAILVACDKGAVLARR
jgi:hypothetical protein